MKTEEELAGSHSDIESEIEELNDRLRVIAPEVVADEKQAVAEAKKIKRQVAELEDQSRLRDMAAEEQTRRAAEAAAKQDLENREAARQEFARGLEAFVEIEKDISRLTAELLSKCKAYIDKAIHLSGAAVRAADPSIQANTDGLRRTLGNFLRANMMDVIPDVRGERAHAQPLEQQHAKWVDATKASFGQPLPPRPSKVKVPPPSREPEPVVFFEPPPVREEGADIGTPKQPVTVLIAADGTVKQMQTPPTKEVKQARSVYRGGYKNIVKQEDVEPLLKAGYTLRRGFIHPSGMHQIGESFKEERSK